MEYDGTVEGDIPGNRLQMDMYVCAPWGNYELEISVKSTNGVDADGKPKRMEKVAWEVEYGPDEVCTYICISKLYIEIRTYHGIHTYVLV